MGNLTEAERAALMTLPLPGLTAHRVFMGVYRNVSYSSTWRKSAKHRRALEALEQRGIVEQTESRGETLWRLTRPAGIEVRQSLEGQPA